jgi:hypothetical protein
MTKHAIRKPKAYKGERTWPEILEATGPLINFLESVSNQVAAKWRGSVPPSIYGVTVDGRELPPLSSEKADMTFPKCRKVSLGP